MTLAQQLVHYFDEWEQILPPDARDALGVLVDEARSATMPGGDVVREKLAAAGLTDEGMLDAVLGTFARLRDENLALHRRLAGETMRADLGWGRAESKSRECIELRERMATRPAIPRTPEQAIAFIGNQCEVIEEAEQPENWRFTLTAHDLLSAFTWWFGDEGQSAPGDGQIYEAASRRADPAAHDAALAESLAVFGASAWLTPAYKAAQKAANAAASQRLANVGRDQTAVPGVPESAETRTDAGSQPLSQGGPDSPEFEGIKESVAVTEKGPWQVNDWGEGRIVIQSDDFRHNVALEVAGDFATASDKRIYAEEIARRLNTVTGEFYTCIGKGGEYELLGIARGAGTSRDLVELVVYRSVEGGAVFYRSVRDFTDRLQKIEDPA